MLFREIERRREAPEAKAYDAHQSGSKSSSIFLLHDSLYGAAYGPSASEVASPDPGARTGARSRSLSRMPLETKEPERRASRRVKRSNSIHVELNLAAGW